VRRGIAAVSPGRPEGEAAAVKVKPKIKAGKREKKGKKISKGGQFKAAEDAGIKK
jgi:hypothetical protein